MFLRESYYASSSPETNLRDDERWLVPIERRKDRGAVFKLERRPRGDFKSKERGQIEEGVAQNAQERHRALVFGNRGFEIAVSLDFEISTPYCLYVENQCRTLEHSHIKRNE